MDSRVFKAVLLQRQRLMSAEATRPPTNPVAPVMKTFMKTSQKNVMLGRLGFILRCHKETAMA